MRLSIVLAVCAALAGCLVGPDYKRPATPLPAQYRLEEQEAAAVSNIPWWDQFGDPALSSLVREALKNNQDLLVATARVDQFLAAYGVSRSALFPTVGAGADAGRARSSETTAPPALPGQQVSNNFDVGLNASYEIDLWGRIRRLNEAARANLVASEEGRRTVVLTLVTAVANAYIELRALEEQREISIRTVDSRREALQLQKLRFDGGQVSEMVYRQSESQYYAAVVAAREAERLIGRQEDAISVLLGTPAAAIPRGKRIGELRFPQIPAGVPSDLLARRPDILEAEQNLIAANANIGAAKAQYFPTISLTGVLGVQSADLSNLFKGASGAWSYVGSLAQPIFTGGLLRSQVEQAEAVQRQALYSYQGAIVSAFSEVDTALIDRVKFAEEMQGRGKQVYALGRYLDLANIRYAEGYSTYLEVTNAESELFDAQLSFVGLQSQFFQAYTNLYKAMGGGWVGTAEQVADSPATRTSSPAQQNQASRQPSPPSAAASVGASAAYAVVPARMFAPITPSGSTAMPATSAPAGAALGAAAATGKRPPPTAEVRQSMPTTTAAVAPSARGGASRPTQPQKAATTAAGTAKPTQDRIEIQAEDGRTVVNVHHVRGIGGFELFQPRSGWPVAVIVRLHGFPALEMFRAKGADGLLLCELQRPEGQPPKEQCRVGSARIDAVRKRGGIYEVTLPVDRLAANGGSVEVRWVDQWR